MSESLRYPSQIFFSDEDGGYIAIAPDLPGCSAFGETAEEALRELQDAIKAWIGAANKAGNPIPPPSPRQAEELPSGRILLRLPKTLHAQLIERATRDGTSLNSCLVMLLSQAVVRERPAARRFDLAGSLVTAGLVDWSVHAWLNEAVATERPGKPKETRVSRGGSILNFRSLPVGKPVLYMEDKDG
jgi:predicted RNase H-like HicB family nuclease